MQAATIHRSANHKNPFKQKNSLGRSSAVTLLFAPAICKEGRDPLRDKEVMSVHVEG